MENYLILRSCIKLCSQLAQSTPDVQALTPDELSSLLMQQMLDPHWQGCCIQLVNKQNQVVIGLTMTEPLLLKMAAPLFENLTIEDLSENLHDTVTETVNIIVGNMMNGFKQDYEMSPPRLLGGRSCSGWREGHSYGAYRVLYQDKEEMVVFLAPVVTGG